MIQLLNDNLGIKIDNEGKLLVIDPVHNYVWKTKYITGWIIDNEGDKIPFSIPERIDVKGNTIEIEWIATPLFNLVYHDAIVCYWQHGQPFGREDHVNHILHDLLTVQPSSWSIVYEQFEDLFPLIKQVYLLLGKLHERLAFNKMIKHEFISEDLALQRTYFDNGTEIIVNFGITSFLIDKHKIPPKGFVIFFNEKEVIIGRLTRDIEYL